MVLSPFILSKPPTGGSNGGVCLWPSVVLATGAALEKYVRSGHFSVQKPTMAFHFLSRSQSTYNNFSVSCLISSGPLCPTPRPFKPRCVHPGLLLPPHTPGRPCCRAWALAVPSLCQKCPFISGWLTPSPPNVCSSVTFSVAPPVIAV